MADQDELGADAHDEGGSPRPDDVEQHAHAAPDPATVVGIGASAGGLAALRALFAEVGPDTGMAWVIVVHLSPEHESHLAELLQPHLQIPIEQVSETVPLQADRAYVIPPNANLDSVDTHLRLSELPDARRERAPIDHFFRTLSRTHDGDAIGVILTGTGSDGTLGLREIKEKGGLTVVQDPGEAEYGGMPQSAVSTGLIDLVLPLAEIPGRIIDYVRTQPRVPDPGDSDEDRDDERELHRVFAQIRARTGHDFTRYKNSTILRRIARRMAMRGAERLDDYVELLRAEPDEVRTLAEDLLITVTNFFRDPEIFERLASTVVPELLDGKGPDDTVRVWSVGCATGEEAYSVAILLLEAAGRLDAPPQIQVFASDLHERSLATAREGFYPGNIAADVSQERLERYFEQEDGGYRIRAEVRELVVFSPHNLLGDPPFSHLDLVTCRNLLIYLERQVQRDVLELFHYALRADGVLVLGTSETIDDGDLFATLDDDQRIYRRRNVRAPEPRLPVFPLAPRRTAVPADEPGPRPQPVAPGVLHQRTVEHHAPPSMLVSPDDRVVHLSEHVGRFLVHSGGQPTANAVKLVREELRMELRSALHDAREDGGATQSAPQRVRFNGEAGWVVMLVRGAVEPGLEDHVVVLFIDLGDNLTPGRRVEEGGTVSADPGADVSAERVDALEAELDLTRSRLRSLVEEYETSQEELRASNEELQSSNEELRSTLEELETSKEELQSINEELQTVNEENRHKVEELSQLSDDLQNLLAATDIATLFLDRGLRIMRFTPRVTELFNIRRADRGRPVSDLTHRLAYDELVEDARRVLERLVPVEREVSDGDDNWFLTRVLPYRSHDDRIDGVVLTFVDITARKHAEQDLLEATARTEQVAATLRRSEERYRTLFESMDEGFCVMEVELDAAGAPTDVRFVETNPAFAVHTGLQDADGQRLLELEPGMEAHWVERFGRVARTGDAERFEAQAQRLGDRWLEVYAFSIGDVADHRVAALLRDVTERRRAEQELQSLTEQLEERVQERTRQVRELSETLTLAEQQERQRLSQLLHDDLQQLLYGIQMHVAMAREQAEDGEEVRHATRQALDHLEDAITRTRQLTVDLDPPILHDEGLVDALGWLRSHVRDLHGLDVEIRGSAQVDVAPSSRRVLAFQIVRELLFNVAKHGETDHAVVTVEETDDGVRVTVADHGAGFDPASIGLGGDHGSGLGLVTARERLQLQGGDLEMRSVPGEGALVVFQLPSAASTARHGDT